MRLVEPSIDFAEQIRVYRNEFLSCGSSMDGTGALRRIEDPLDWIERSIRGKDPATVPDGLVPATQYMFVREDDLKIVGMIQIRHYLNDFLEKYGGHIGYSVAPSERRKGYAARMLRAVLPLCAQLGISDVLITCIEGNEGSKRTMLKNGGVYESTVFEPDGKVYLERYRIKLSGRPGA